MNNDNNAQSSRLESTGYSSDPKYPASSTVSGGAEKPMGAKVAEFLGMDVGDNYRAVEGDGPSTAEPILTTGEMGTGNVRKAEGQGVMGMEGEGGRLGRADGLARGEGVGGMSGTGDRLGKNDGLTDREDVGGMSGAGDRLGRNDGLTARDEVGGMSGSGDRLGRNDRLATREGVGAMSGSGTGNQFANDSTRDSEFNTVHDATTLGNNAQRETGI